MQGHSLRALQLVTIWAILVALTACSVIGVPAPRGFAEQLAVGYASVTAVRESATTLLEGDRISAADAVNVQAQADQARAALDVAASLRGIDPAAAQDRLEATLTILQALQSYLEGRRQ